MQGIKNILQKLTQPENTKAIITQQNPDITDAEADRLTDLFLQALNGKTKEEREAAFKIYQQALKPIQQRSQKEPPEFSEICR